MLLICFLKSRHPPFLYGLPGSVAKNLDELEKYAGGAQIYFVKLLTRLAIASR